MKADLYERDGACAMHNWILLIRRLFCMIVSVFTSAADHLRSTSTCSINTDDTHQYQILTFMWTFPSHTSARLTKWTRVSYSCPPLVNSLDVLQSFHDLAYSKELIKINFDINTFLYMTEAFSSLFCQLNQEITHILAILACSQSRSHNKW